LSTRAEEFPATTPQSRHLETSGSGQEWINDDFIAILFLLDLFIDLIQYYVDENEHEHKKRIFKNLRKVIQDPFEWLSIH
jgi:hypothetical protein